MMKLSSIFLLSIFLLTAFVPEANAKRYCRNRSSFGLSFNVGAPAPSYVVAPAPAPVVVQPAPVAVMPYPTYNSYVSAPPQPYYYTQNYYPQPYYAPHYAPQPVVIERRAPNVYVQPGLSFSYRR